MMNYSTSEIADALTSLVNEAIAYGDSYFGDKPLAEACDKISKQLCISWEWKAGDNAKYPIFSGSLMNYVEITEPPEDSPCEFCREVDCNNCEHTK